MTHWLEGLQSSPYLRIVGLGFIVLVLQIPIGMFKDVIYERQQRRQMAIDEITGKWGREQSIIGPVLILPFEKKILRVEDDGQTRITRVKDHAVFLPDVLKVRARVESNVLSRGIYNVPVYSAELSMTGEFSPLDFSHGEIPDQDVFWEQATLSVSISDERAVSSASQIVWGAKVLSLEPSSKLGGDSGIHARVPSEHTRGVSIEFGIDLKIQGSNSISFAPLGEQSSISMNSNWKDPSFTGPWLPVRRSSTATGFDAEWSVELLGKNYPRGWIGLTKYQEELTDSLVGTRFLPGIAPYRMLIRSLQYHMLFLVVVFMGFWLFEVVGEVELHFMQYISVGGVMCLFYLLELSLAEHVEFVWAYGGSAFIVCLLFGGYVKSILKSGGPTTLMVGVLILLYGFLYMDLSDQDFTLLIGAIGGLFLLGIGMFLTRNVDWAGRWYR